MGADLSEAAAAIALGDAYIGRGYDWQDDVVGCWLATDASGKYAATTCGLDLPRQNGKTKRCIARRLLYGAAGKGEAIRYSAHRVDTMLELFEIFVDIFGDPRVAEDEWRFPEIHDEVTRFCFKNGHEKIEFKSGGFIRFVSRATGAGRGSTVDVNVYDEAQFLTQDQVAAAKPGQSAAPLRNPQTIYVGTPPSEAAATGEVFGRVRTNALAGVPGICWHEWSVAEIGDVSDRARWFATNPSLGKSLLESAVADELNDMTPLKFAIERLCYWPESASERPVRPEKWDASALEKEQTPGRSEVERTCVGVKFEPGGGRVCASVALRLAGGERGKPRIHVELARDDETLGGTSELVDWIARGKGSIACVAIDGKSGGEALRNDLVAAGFPRKGIVLMSPGQAIAAATTTVNLLAEDRLTHLADQTLDASAKGAVKRRIGGDGYGFGGDSCPVESASAAAWAAVTTKRNPKRKQRVG